MQNFSLVSLNYTCYEKMTMGCEYHFSDPKKITFSHYDEIIIKTPNGKLVLSLYYNDSFK